MKNNLFLLLGLLSSFIVFSQENKGQTPKIIQSQGVTGPDLCESYYVYLDNDHDGYGTGNKICYDLVIDEGQYALVGGDCNDNNPAITISRYWYLDNDGDGYGNTPTATMQCTPPNASYKALGGDCNDGNAAINPNTKWYRDADNDTFGNAAVFLTQCTQPAGYVLNSTDCNDSNVAIHPNTKWYRDADGDAFGNPLLSLTQCTQPAGYVLNNTDCSDSNSSLNVTLTWYADADGDGFGDPAITTTACTQPTGYVSNNQDLCPSSNGTFQGCAVPTTTTGFGNDKNYIITITPKKPVSNITQIANSADVNTGIVYYDEIGRPMQQIANAQSNSGKDIVTHIKYDDFGREVKDYLPYPSTQNSMQYVDKATAESNTLSHYQNVYGDGIAYGERSFDGSPLNRVLKEAAPGVDWAIGSNHEIKTVYDTNAGTEVKLLQATATWNASSGLYDISISNPGNYPTGQLIKTVTKNENWTSGVNNTIEEFQNKEGQVVLKRAYNAGTAHDTFYVYDQYGNLTYVLPPLANGAVDASTLDGLCYQYKYDNRNRLVEKKLPGKQWEFMVYDKLDRVVATGPVFSPFNSIAETGWLVTKYDVFNRAVLTAWQPSIVNSSQRTTLQNLHNSASILNENRSTSTTMNSVTFNYSNQAEPKTGYHVLTVNYFDDYIFPGAASIPSTVLGQTVYYNNTLKPKGLPTGSWIRIPETTTAPFKAEITSIFYDEKARPIQSRLVNHLSGYTEVSTKLDFSGKVLQTVTKHKKDGGASPAEITVTEDFTYSAQDRLLTQTHQIGTSAKQLLVSNAYDELGQLITKKIGGTDVTGNTGLQKVDYKYNIRGWLKEINNVDNLIEGSNPKDLFAYKINYNDNAVSGLPAQEMAVSKLYNGNISEVFWRTASDDKKRKYGYYYDDLNRLKEAVFQDPTSSVVTNSFNESLTYDANGNIITLNRKDYLPNLPYNTTIDNLNYIYHATSKNQLVKVTDNSANANGFKDVMISGDDYTYDANGNMLTDVNKGITGIVYNHLNLPTKITFANGTIEYLYNAAGQKVEKKVTETGQQVKPTLYLGGYQYVNGFLEFFPTTEGYVKYNAGSFSSYVYNYTDHLGNVRVSYKDNAGVLQIVDENNYYPFGLKHNGYNQFAATAYKYKYNGKELQDELGLNVTAMDFRQYDSAIGRFLNPDRLSELSYDITPNRFAFNNPNIFTDPSGLFENGGQRWEGWVNTGSQVFWDPNVNNQDDVNRIYDGKGYNYMPDGSVVVDSNGNRRQLNGDGTVTTLLDEVTVSAKSKKKTFSDYYGAVEFNYNGVQDIALGAGLDGFRNYYNNNYDAFNRNYYNFYKATNKSSKLPKPSTQRQILKRLLSNSKFSASSKLLRRAGVVGTVLTVGNIGIDVAEDGAIKASSIIDGGSIAALGVATVFCPPCAVAIGAGMLVYGIADYTFEINDTIDANTEQIQIFDK